jgi:hypothetical protein
MPLQPTRETRAAERGRQTSSETREMMTPDVAHLTTCGRVRRVSAVLLSLWMRGAGHFLLGAFRRGAAWAVGLPLLGLLLLFATPAPLVIVSMLIVGLVSLAGRVATAIDTGA